MGCDFSTASPSSCSVRHVTKSRSPQVLLDSALTNGDARNSFRIRSYENWRVSLDPLNIPTLKPFNLPTFTDLSLFLSHSCALFCTHQNLNSFVFMRFRTLCQKPPRVGYPAFRREDQNEPSKN